MLYQFAKDAASHVSPGLALRTLRDVRLGPTTTFLFNYLAQEHGVARYLHEQRCFYGGVVTVRDSNFDEALSPEFADFLVDSGFIYTLFAVTDGLSGEQRDDALSRIKKLKSKPIFIYNSLTGHTDADSRGCMARELCVNKNGEMMTGRKTRGVIGSIADVDLTEVAADPEWRKRFLE